MFCNEVPISYRVIPKALSPPSRVLGRFKVPARCLCAPRHKTPDPAAQDVLYPSEDVEEQLALLSVYPEPEDIGDAAAAGGAERVADDAADSAGSPQGQAPPGDSSAEAATAAGGLQGKTDEVLKSITDSFATVTDMFGGVPPGGITKASKSGGGGGSDGAAGSSSSSSAQQPAGATAPKPDRFGANTEEEDAGGGIGGGGGWDLFKPPSMAEMKRRLDDIKAGAGGLSLSPPKAPQASSFGAPAPAAASLSVRRTGGRSVSPARQDAGSAAAAGLAKFGEGWRDFRRRSTEAVEEAVTKLKTALDDSDDEGAADARVAARIAEKSRVKAAAAKARTGGAAAGGAGGAGGGGGGGAEDDPFWKPFGDGEVGGGDEPVPLPTMQEVRLSRAAGDSRSASAARTDLDSYYGGGGGGGSGGDG